MFQFIWQSGFRGEDFCLEINQSETRIACGGHVCKWIGTKLAICIGFREEALIEINQS
jgi:hypothetical protein